MSNEHPDMHGNPMDAPFLCHQCEKEVREDQAYGSDAAPSEMFCSLECVNEWQESQIATLARERDEARKEVERLTDNLKVSRLFVDGVSKHLECGATLENSGNWSSYCETVANNYMLRMTEACKLRDSLAAELAALKSAPGMEDVDALSGDFTAEECDQPCLTTWMQRNKKLANLARRSIAALKEKSE